MHNVDSSTTDDNERPIGQGCSKQMATFSELGLMPIFSQTQSSYAHSIATLLGKGKNHAGQLYAHWFRKGHLEGLQHWVEPQALSLVKEMIELTDFSLPVMSRIDADGKVVKFLLKFKDGLESESVLIPMESGNTLCISSQVGCKMGCAFCKTGKMGLIRHLTAEEIVAQVFWARFRLGKEVRNIVFMGMGEPFDNYEAVMQAVAVLTDAAGFRLGPSRITISTSGRVKEILRMAAEADPALNLAVSVNAPTDVIRNRIMPVNRSWDLRALKQAMEIYCVHPRREILIEYVLLKGINDSLECAHALADYLEGLRVKVNLIPYNPQPREERIEKSLHDTPTHSFCSGSASEQVTYRDRFSPPESEQREQFLQAMRARGYQTLLRTTKGDQVRAACGQLGHVGVRREWLSKLISCS